MSDSMAFMGGAALAGIAALVLLRGGANPALSNLPTSPPLPIPSIQPSAIAPFPQPTYSPDLSSYWARQQMDTERLKLELEQQRNETEQLKAQLQNQQVVIDALTAQAKGNQVPSQVNSIPELAKVQQPATSSTYSGILWALGGMMLTVSGLFLAGVFVLLSQQPRSARTVQVIHPLNSYHPPLPSRRRSEFLPPRLAGRQVDSVEYDD